jgi:hypothetical protein
MCGYARTLVLLKLHLSRVASAPTVYRNTRASHSMSFGFRRSKGRGVTQPPHTENEKAKEPGKDARGMRALRQRRVGFRQPSVR